MLWFALSVTYVVWVNYMQMDWNYKYFYISAASLPFATGALLFHFRSWINENINIPGQWAYALFIFLIVNWAAGLEFGTLKTISFYINYVICALLITVLQGVRELRFISRKADKLIGDLSYPMYLIHYQVGLLVFHVVGNYGYEVTRHNVWHALISLPPILLTAWLMANFIEKPIEKARDMIKRSNPERHLLKP